MINEDHLFVLTIQHNDWCGLHETVGRAAGVGSGIGHVRVRDSKRTLDRLGFHAHRKCDADAFSDITLKFLTIFKPVNIIRNEVISRGIAGYLERFVRIYMLSVRYVDDCKIEDKEGLRYLEL